MNRITLLALCLGFSLFGVRLAAAQTPQPRTAAVNQPANSAVPGKNGAAKEPEQTKVARIYRGDGFFDAGLAKKLQPVLAQAFGVESATDSKPGDNRSKSPDLLRSILGQNQGANQNTLAKTGQP
jgi:hypothetical protein